MAFTQRVWCLHNGKPMGQMSSTITRFVNKSGTVCDHTPDYVWWQNLGLFHTKSEATKYAKEHHINLTAHCMTLHEYWLYKLALEDMIQK